MSAETPSVPFPRRSSVSDALAAGSLRLSSPWLLEEVETEGGQVGLSRRLATVSSGGFTVARVMRRPLRSEPRETPAAWPGLPPRALVSLASNPVPPGDPALPADVVPLLGACGAAGTEKVPAQGVAHTTWPSRVNLKTPCAFR